MAHMCNVNMFGLMCSCLEGQGAEIVTLCIMHMLLLARSQRSFEFTRILMTDLRKSGMWEDVKTMLQAQKDRATDTDSSA